MDIHLTETVTGYETLVAALESWGIEVCAGVTGGGAIRFLEKLAPLHTGEDAAGLGEPDGMRFLSLGEYAVRLRAARRLSGVRPHRRLHRDHGRGDQAAGLRPQRRQAARHPGGLHRPGLAGSDRRPVPAAGHQPPRQQHAGAAARRAAGRRLRAGRFRDHGPAAAPGPCPAAALQAGRPGPGPWGAQDRDGPASRAAAAGSGARLGRSGCLRRCVLPAHPRPARRHPRRRGAGAVSPTRRN